jgi:hypothetical protein
VTFGTGVPVAPGGHAGRGGCHRERRGRAGRDGGRGGPWRAFIHPIVEKSNLYGIILIPVALGMVYGTLGGGVYEFLKCRRIARHPDIAPK